MSTARLSPTSYLVLGLLAREGPSTPYDLARQVGATLGNFWPFPHTPFYNEPPRLAALGLVTEVREPEGRRRRVFTITEDGTAALNSWLDRPSDGFSELRDLGLMQLFFADLTTAASRLRLAEHQLAIHRTRLAAYQREVSGERVSGRTENRRRTVERWRAETLQMGVLYEGVAVDFWTAVVATARADPDAGDQGQDRP